MLQFKEYIINKGKKLNLKELEENKNKGDYIIKSAMPLIFKKKKIKKVADLLEKGNFDKKEEEDFSLENEDLSEKFFEKYFQLQIDPEKPKKLLQKKRLKMMTMNSILRVGMMTMMILMITSLLMLKMMTLI